MIQKTPGEGLTLRGTEWDVGKRGECREKAEALAMRMHLGTQRLDR